MHIEKKQNNKWLSDGVLRKLWGCYSVSKDPHILEQIVSGTLPLVDFALRRCSSQNYEYMEREDIYSYGVIGLMEAIHRYNPDKNPCFSRYAYIRIQGAMYDGIIRFRGLSRNYLRKRRLLLLRMEEAQQEVSRDLTQYEICECLGMEEGQYLRIINEERGMYLLSLDNIENREGLVQELRTSECYIEDTVMQNKMQNILQNAISQLRPIEQSIIYMHYYQGIALREIGRRTGYSHAWITKNHKMAMEQLKNMKIRDFLDK